MKRAYRKWTEEEIEKLMSSFNTKPVHVIAEELNRTVRAITVKASRLGLTHDQRLKPIWDITPDPSDLKAIAWAIVTEGTIGIRSQKYRSGNVGYDPYVTVGNCNLTLLGKFKQMVGAGRIYRHPKKIKRRTCYHWVLNRTIETLELLELIKQFLPIKKGQAELVIRLCKLRLGAPRGKPSPHKEEERALYQKVRRLNREGK